MAHLAQDAAVGARDALDGECGAVGVDGKVHAGLAVLAHVLRATWPLAMSWVSTSSLAIKRPSPWLMATV